MPLSFVAEIGYVSVQSGICLPRKMDVLYDLGI